MSHEFEKGFYMGKPAWHGLGVVLDQAIDAEQAWKLAFPWSAIETKLYAEIPNTNGSQLPTNGFENIGTKQIEVKSHKLLVRSDTMEELAVVTSDYEVFQPWDFAQYIQPLLDTKHFELETGLCLRKGKRLVIVCKVKDRIAEIVKNDSVSMYLLICQGMDGTLAIHILPTPYRVECMNMLQMALSHGERKAIKIRHSKSMNDKLQEVQNVLLTMSDRFDRAIDQYQTLANKPLNQLKLTNYVYDVLEFKPGEKNKDGELIEAPKAFREILVQHEIGAGQKITGVQGTYWGAYNAVTDYVDHVSGRKQASRVDSALFGPGAMLKERALNLALSAN